ncbi:unnamed protein product, partial [Urochloa humidicola]
AIRLNPHLPLPTRAPVTLAPLPVALLHRSSRRRPPVAPSAPLPALHSRPCLPYAPLSLSPSLAVASATLAVSRAPTCGTGAAAGPVARRRCDWRRAERRPPSARPLQHILLSSPLPPPHPPPPRRSPGQILAARLAVASGDGVAARDSPGGTGSSPRPAPFSHRYEGHGLQSSASPGRSRSVVPPPNPHPS